MDNSIKEIYDMHTHILPGVDDGSTSMEQTIEMLKLMKTQEVNHIVATPHYIKGRNKYDTGSLKDIISKVSEEAKKIDPDMKIYCGNEVYYTEGVLDDLKASKIMTISNSRYVLVEFNTEIERRHMYNGMRKFIENMYIPVIAHVERYEHLDSNSIYELIKLGCIIQMNTESVMGGLFDSESKRCRKLIKDGLVHILGSDCHNTDSRRPLMKDAINQLLKKNVDIEIINKITSINPEKILTNKYI